MVIFYAILKIGTTTNKSQNKNIFLVFFFYCKNNIKSIDFFFFFSKKSIPLTKMLFCDMEGVVLYHNLTSVFLKDKKKS